MYVLTTTQYTPYFFGLLMHRTHVTLGVFDTYNDACGWAFNVCGFNTSVEFSIDYDEEATLTYVTFCEDNKVSCFATSPSGSVVACSFKPSQGD